jgi:hypothetical protein
MRNAIGGEPVTSRFLPQDGPAIYMAFSVRIGSRTLIVGIGIGDGPTCTPIAQEVVRLVCDHAGNKEMFIVLCTNKETARYRVTQILRGAKEGTPIMIFCKDSKVYDAVLLPKLIGLERATNAP